MKKILLILSVFLIAGCRLQVSAHPIDTATARTVAIHFLQSLNITSDSSPEGRGDSQQVYGALTDVSRSMPFTEFYTFTFNEGNGFILVATDDCVTPILGYSLTNGISLDKMPENLYSWLEGYNNEIARIKNESPKQPGISRSKTLKGKTSPKTVYGPLIQTTWNQAPYYNALCPTDISGSKTVAGCVAVVGAQIMKYWNYPTTGYGSHSYYHNDWGILSADFGATTYDWNNMPNALTASSSPTEKNAVATLIYHVGVAVEMNYGVNISGAFTNVGYGGTQPTLEEALAQTFKYVPTLHTEYRSDYSTEQWKEILVNELSNSRPIIYCGNNGEGGHAFICDGYNTSTDLFHFNWGWGGAYDGWFVITDLHTQGSGIGGNSTNSFNLNNRAIVGIQPNYNFGDSTTVTLTINDSTMGSISGAGTYAFGDTISLRAIATTGHRFVHWDIFEKHNSCYTIATGGNYTINAEFEALSGDTLYYCTGGYPLSCIRPNNTATGVNWGIRLPASTLTAGHDLKMVQFYPGGAGPYELTVYVGGTADSNAAYSTTYHVSEVNGDRWNTIVLTTPVSVTGAEDIYITFYNNTIAYPAAVTYGSGNSDGILMGSDFTDITGDGGYSIMIKGIFQGVISDSLSLICPDIVQTDVPATFRAVASAGSTVTWSLPDATPSTATGDSVSVTWTEAGSYTISATATNSNGSTTKYYIVEVTDCHLIVEGDTVSYVGNNAATGMKGYENVGLYWGIKIPAGQLSQVDTLGSVLLYVHDPAHYTLSISQGNRPETPLYTQTYYFFNTNTYNVCPLPEAFVPDKTKDLWITFHCSDVSYPAVHTSYVNDTNSNWFSGDGEGWGQLDDVSWMIKLITGTPTPTPPTVVVSGLNAGATGQEYTYKVRTDRESTVTWSLPGATVTSSEQVTSFTSQVSAIWPSTGIYPVIATATDMLGSASDTLYVNIVECNNIEEFPYTFDFEDVFSLACWTTIDADGDGHCWGKWNHGYNSELSAYSASYSGHTLHPDNWLVSPTIVLPQNSNVILTWMEGSYSPTYYAEHYAVYISTTGIDTSDFVLLMEHTLDSCEWSAQQLNLESYAGQEIHLAFRHFGCTDICHLYIDDITINTTPTSGIDDNSQFSILNSQFSIYPNPVDGVVNIDVGEPATLMIMDITGRVWYTGDLVCGKNTIEVHGLSTGVYLVQVTSGGSTATRKLLVR